MVQQALGHVEPRSTPVYADLSDLHLRPELELHRRCEKTLPSGG
jgi:hypothetical protein